MDAMDFWRICDELTVVQAALLIVGGDPAASQKWVFNWEPFERPDGFDAAFAALTHAIAADRLPATIRYAVEQKFDSTAEDFFPFETDEPDWHRTTVLVDDLKPWLKSRGITTGFFFPSGGDAPDYLNRNHPRFAPKLAAAVRAWEAMADEKAVRGRSVKQALSKWLREHAAEFGLSDDDGKPNESGIEMCAKVANWQDKGGAPKTPTE